MEEIVQLIQSFIQDEYEFNLSVWTQDVSNVELEKLSNVFEQKYIHSTMTNYLNGRGSGEFFDEDTLSLLPRKIEKIYARTLFQIKSYKGSTCNAVSIRKC